MFHPLGPPTSPKPQPTTTHFKLKDVHNKVMGQVGKLASDSIMLGQINLRAVSRCDNLFYGISRHDPCVLSVKWDFHLDMVGNEALE